MPHHCIDYEMALAAVIRWAICDEKAGTCCLVDVLLRGIPLHNCMFAAHRSQQHQNVSGQDFGVTDICSTSLCLRALPIPVVRVTVFP